MSETTRREFLATSGAALAGAAGLASLPQMVYGQDKGANNPTLVIVYLRGGADALNTVVPYADPGYYAVRPTIAIPPTDQKDNKGVLKLNQLFGFHPSMQPLHELFNAGVVAPIVNVGSTHDTRSHFDAQDFMERAAPGAKSIAEGWLNRFLQMTSTGKDHELRGLSFQPLLPRSLRGSYPVLAVPDEESESAMKTFEELYACDEKQLQNKIETAQKDALKPGQRPPTKLPVYDPITSEESRETIVQAGANEIRRLRELRSITRGSNRGGKYPGGRFAKQMQDIATVIKANRGLEVAAVDYDGWDHHAYQGGAEGTMANMLQNVSAGLKAFHDDLGAERMKKVLVLTMSEFGRTVKENGTNGTDHGHGGFMLAMGGMVKGKEVYGKYTGLEPQALYQKRDLPVHTDFRIVMAEALAAVFNFDPIKYKFFPEFKTQGLQPLNFLKKVEA